MTTPVFVGAPPAIMPVVLPPRTELRIELRGGEEPIQGHLIDAQEIRTAFAGWAQLVSLIERARGNPDRVVADSASSAHTSTKG